PRLWLSDGWATQQREKWQAPKYWDKIDGDWWHYTLRGFERVNDNEPVTHVSYYEADAYATWRGLRLPTEFEWEAASQAHITESANANFLEDEQFHPVPEHAPSLLGNVWQWTRSAYLPYPGYHPAEGAIGE